MKPLFLQMRDAQKANAIPWNLSKAIAKIGRLNDRQPDVVTLREIKADFKELAGYGIYKNWLRYLRREVRWYKQNGYRVV